MCVFFFCFCVCVCLPQQTPKYGKKQTKNKNKNKNKKSKDYREIMQLLWKRVQDKSHNWRIVFKSLDLLKYLCENGSDRCAEECRDRKVIIRGLLDFRYYDNESGIDRFCFFLLVFFYFIVLCLY